MTDDMLVCPVSRSPLRRTDLRSAEREVGARLVAPQARGYRPVGPTSTVLLRADHLGAYPVRDGHPVLLAPEMLVPEGTMRVVDVAEPRYAEAYEEMEHYDALGRLEARTVAESKAAADLTPLTGLEQADRRTFPEPPSRWLDAKYELRAQYDAFSYLRPALGGRVLQVGGRGLHAVRFLLAGAREAWVVSPMVGELEFATALARHCGVADRLTCVAAIAEELPFPDGSFDGVYAQGCVHHWVVDAALPECHRVLVGGGRFAAVEPWRAPFYRLGVALLGKRDRKVRCQVLTADRVDGPLRTFARSQVVHHGALTRYPLLALWKLRLKPSRQVAWRVSTLDDRVAARFASLRDSGSSVALLGAKAVGDRDRTPARVGTA